MGVSWGVLGLVLEVDVDRVFTHLATWTSKHIYGKTVFHILFFMHGPGHKMKNELVPASDDVANTKLYYNLQDIQERKGRSAFQDACWSLEGACI